MFYAWFYVCYWLSDMLYLIGKCCMRQRYVNIVEHGFLIVSVSWVLVLTEG